MSSTLVLLGTAETSVSGADANLTEPRPTARLLAFRQGSGRTSTKRYAVADVCSNPAPVTTSSALPRKSHSTGRIPLHEKQSPSTSIDVTAIGPWLLIPLAGFLLISASAKALSPAPATQAVVALGFSNSFARVGCVNSVSCTDPPVCREIECANPAARLRRELPAAALRGGGLSLFLTRSDRLEPWGANTCAPLVSP